MAKKKYPSELNTRTIRINIGDYSLLKDLTERLNLTVAEALHGILAEKQRSEPVRISRAQIPIPSLAMMPSPAAVTINGSKANAYIVKPKGGRYD